VGRFPSCVAVLPLALVPHQKAAAEVESLRQPFQRPFGGDPQPELDITITGP
jgi:hypothetical protein